MDVRGQDQINPGMAIIIPVATAKRSRRRRRRTGKRLENWT